MTDKTTPAIVERKGNKTTSFCGKKAAENKEKARKKEEAEKIKGQEVGDVRI